MCVHGVSRRDVCVGGRGVCVCDRAMCACGQFNKCTSVHKQHVCDSLVNIINLPT